jgi:hypothetical protein
LVASCYVLPSLNVVPEPAAALGRNIAFRESRNDIMLVTEKLKAETTSHPVWFFFLIVVVCSSVEGAVLFGMLNGFSDEQLILLGLSAALVSTGAMVTIAEFRDARRKSSSSQSD